MHYRIGLRVEELVEIHFFLGIEKNLRNSRGVFLRAEESVADKHRALAFINCYQDFSISDFLDQSSHQVQIHCGEIVGNRSKFTVNGPHQLLFQLGNRLGFNEIDLTLLDLSVALEDARNDGKIRGCQPVTRGEDRHNEQRYDKSRLWDIPRKFEQGLPRFRYPGSMQRS